MYIDVKVKVHLGCTQQNNVQAVYAGALAADTCILGCRNFHMFWIGADGFNCLQVEALYVQQRFEAACLQHIDHVAGDTAHAKAALDALFEHHVFDIFCSSQGRTACTGLEGEAILEQTGGFDDLCSIACHL